VSVEVRKSSLTLLIISQGTDKLHPTAGAGKSSIMAALFRMVELRSGKISIDGIVSSHIRGDRILMNHADMLERNRTSRPWV
jgi:ABC-type branched-subunit amino acid transport system ATPase component